MSLKQAFCSGKTLEIKDFFSKNKKEKKEVKDNFFTLIMSKETKQS